MEREISIGSATTSAIAGHTTASAFIEDIRNGKYAAEIAAVRVAVRHLEEIRQTANEPELEAAEEKIKASKKTLPAALWNGRFKIRKNTGIEQYSGYLCADIDHVPERLDELLNLAKHDSHVVAAFVSPSGNGFKIIFRVQLAVDERSHQHNYKAVRDHVATNYRAKADEAAKDIARLCYASHDPEAFLNANAEPLDVCVDASPQPNSDEPKSRASADGTEQGGRNNAAFKLACELRDTGKTHDEARSVVREFAAKCNPPLPEVEADTCVKSAFKHPPHFRVPELPALVVATEFLAMKIAPPPELIADILHQGSKLVFGGSSKSFKTWCLLALAISVATGSDWLGFSTSQGKVLFVNFEIQPHAWQKRIAAIARAMGITLTAGTIHLWNLRGHATSFKSLIPLIIERCRAENYALIVLDPIYKLYGGTDENAAGDVAALLNSLERLATETGAAIAFGAHFAKGNAAGKEAIDRISGSGVFARDPDSLLIFTKHEDAEAFVVEPILRNFAPVKPFAVRWAFPLMHRADDLDPAKLKQAGGRKPKHTPADLLALLPPEGLATADWQSAAEATGTSRRTYFRLRNALNSTGKVCENLTAGKWTPVSPE